MADSDQNKADALITALGLAPHPEGGYFRETFRDAETADGRALSTAIYYLLKAGQRSHWHRVDATEIWHWHDGGPLQLSLSPDGRNITHHQLGPDLARGEQPQIIVPKACWQAARPMAAFTLVGCTVAPGFEFAGFEMAPPGWDPKQAG